MNILFFCDWDLTLLYHKVAIQLKKKNINPYALVIGKNFKEYLDKNNENIFFIWRDRDLSRIDIKLHIAIIQILRTKGLQICG